MTESERRKAEEVEKYGIDTILNGLYLYCHGKNCQDCAYINESDGVCQVLEKILKDEDFPSAREVPYGDREPEEDPRADRRDWEDYD